MNFSYVTKSLTIVSTLIAQISLQCLLQPQFIFALFGEIILKYKTLGKYFSNERNASRQICLVS